MKSIFFRVTLLFACYLGVLCNEYRTNVILIMFDDLRPLFRSYGEKHMITPNLDRLAAKSVLFENANCQVAVCNPSRNSMMTGLRPDTIASYAFLNSWVPHLSFPQQFAYHGYNIANYGKIYHWDDFQDNLGIGYGIGASNWYEYQGHEYDDLNSTVNPDRQTPEDLFRDYIYTSKMIEGLKKVNARPEYFLLGIGFKLPHIHLHYPWKYYDMYRSASPVWSKVSSTNLRYPPSSPPISYRCCAYGEYRFMNDEGNAHWNETLQTNPDLTRAFPPRMYEELIWSYSASITYLDTQIGRILDAIEAEHLWNNVTIILTSDHGMHNGEKGIWEKWTLFEESTRVPLLIYHPKSPFPGQRYQHPVEILDIYPTLIDLNDFPSLIGNTCPKDARCRPLNGQSLAPVILGPNFKKIKSHSSNEGQVDMPLLSKRMAVTQVIRCAPRNQLQKLSSHSLSIAERDAILSTIWNSCDGEHRDHEVSLMGYSIRSKSYRYTAYLPFNRRVNQVYNLTSTSYTSSDSFHYLYEELYDHQEDHLKPLIDRELVNLAHSPKYSKKIQEWRRILERFLRTSSLQHEPKSIVKTQ